MLIPDVVLLNWGKTHEVLWAKTTKKKKKKGAYLTKFPNSSNWLALKGRQWKDLIETNSSSNLPTLRNFWNKIKLKKKRAKWKNRSGNLASEKAISPLDVGGSGGEREAEHGVVVLLLLLVGDGPRRRRSTRNHEEWGPPMVAGPASASTVRRRRAAAANGDGDGDGDGSHQKVWLHCVSCVLSHHSAQR